MKSEKFAFHFLFNELHEGKQKTFVARSQRLPDIENVEVFAYVQELNDVRKINYESIVAVLKTNVLQ